MSATGIRRLCRSDSAVVPWLAVPFADAGLREDFLAAGGAADFTVSLLAEEAPEDETSVPGANDFGFEGER